MIQGGDGAGFAFKAFVELGLGDLYCNDAVQTSITRLVHPAHATSANGREDLVGSEFGSGCECHFFSSGTRRRSSSKKFSTRVAWLGAGVPDNPAGMIAAIRLPSGATS